MPALPAVGTRYLKLHHNPSTDAPSLKRVPRQRGRKLYGFDLSVATRGTMHHSLNGPIFPIIFIVNAVLQGLRGTEDSPATQPDEDEDLEHFNGESRGNSYVA